MAKKPRTPTREDTLVPVDAQMQGSLASRLEDGHDLIAEGDDSHVDSSYVRLGDESRVDRIADYQLSSLMAGDLEVMAATQADYGEISAVIKRDYRIGDDARGIPVRVFTTEDGITGLHVAQTIGYLDNQITALQARGTPLPRDLASLIETHGSIGESFSLRDALEAESADAENQRVLQTLGEKYAASFDPALEHSRAPFVYAVPPK